MSFPNIPDVDAAIEITATEAINLLLASIAFEELGLAHIINAEAEKIQFVLGTLEGETPPETPPTLEDLLEINDSVNRTLRNVIKKEMLLQFKLEDVLVIPTGGEDGSGFVEVGSAWSVGTPFGHGNAEYTTLGAEETDKTVALGLGHNHIPIGTVHIVRNDDTISVTIATDSPFVMNEVHLYVSDVPPTNSAPGSFPFQFTVTDPIDFFTSHTFVVPIGGFGEPLFIAAHAKILQPN